MAGNLDNGGGLLLLGRLSARLGSRWRILVWATAAALLVLPLIAMQFTDEVAWDEADFVVFGAMLVGAIGAYEMAARMTGNRPYRAAVAVGLAAAFILIWVNGAVGIIGSEDNPANRIYGGVLAVAVVSAFLARFRPLGLARAMVATAIAQALVFLIALIAGLGFTGPITVFFAALWLISAWLFRKAARDEISAGAAP